MEEITQEKKLLAKLQQIQEEFTFVKKNKQNSHFKNTYVDINTLLQEIRPILKKHNILLIQPLIFKDSKSLLRTILTDMDTGEEYISEIVIPELSDPQKIGSAITYYRRYSIITIFLLETLDDDGEAANGRGRLAGKIDHSGAIKRMNTMEELRLYLAKYPDEKNVLMPLLTARKLEITNATKE